MFKCEWCIQPYDGYTYPYLLPCCNKSICDMCLRKIEIKTLFECLICGREMPSNGLAVNHELDKLVIESFAQPQPINKQELDSLDLLADELSFKINNGELQVIEECSELKRQVQLAKEQLIASSNNNQQLNTRIEVNAEIMISQIVDLQKDYTQNLSKIETTKKEMTSRISILIEQHKSFLLQTNNMSENENLTRNETFKRKIDREKESIRAKIFSNQIIKFEANHSLNEEGTLGRFKSEQIIFTVSIYN